MRSLERTKRLLRLGKRVASDAHTPYAMPKIFSVIRMDESPSAKLPENVGKHMERAMLMDNVRKMIMHRRADAGAPIGNNPRHCCILANKMGEKSIVSVAQFIAREKYPRDRDFSFRIKRDVECERLLPDHEMLPVEHEDADIAACGTHDEYSRFDTRILRALDAAPCGRAAHAPADTQPTERRSIEKVAQKPPAISVPMLLVRTECVAAGVAMPSPWTIWPGSLFSALHAPNSFLYAYIYYISVKSAVVIGISAEFATNYETVPLERSMMPGKFCLGIGHSGRIEI